MSELRALTAAARALREARQPFVSALVVAVNGSGYRKAGARMIATPDQWRAGSISGGCLERDVTNKGEWYTRAQRSCVVTYDQSEDEGEHGTGCQGVVEVLIERHTPDHLDATDYFVTAERCLRDESCAAVVTVVRSSRADVPLAARLVLRAGELHTELEPLRIFADVARELPALPRVVERDGLAVLIETVQPPVHLFVFGTSHDAVPLVAHAKNLGWTVSVWDASPSSAARERFPQADHYLTSSVQDAVARASRAVRPAAVVMGHHFARDRAALVELLRSRTRYVGVLGARNRTAQLLDAVSDAGVELDDATRARLHAPIGLQIGSETPSEIALSIVAEIQRTYGRAK
ncbi:MAG: XdhC/CoxI family protein [Polyangiales bacterium]